MIAIWYTSYYRKGGAIMKTKEIIKSIVEGKNEYFGYSHFDASNMADYTLMSCTINDLASVYDINEVQAAEIIQSLTH